MFAVKVHQDIVTRPKSACVWGVGVYDDPSVAREYALNDGDMVELRT